METPEMYSESLLYLEEIKKTFSDMIKLAEEDGLLRKAERLKVQIELCEKKIQVIKQLRNRHLH